MKRDADFWYPLTSEVKPKRICAFDIEGEGGEGGFGVGTLVCDDGKWVFTDKEKMRRFLVSKRMRGRWLFAHNLEYDYPLLYFPFPVGHAPFITQRGLIFSDVRVSATDKVHFRDSAIFYPNTTVDGLGRSLGYEKIPTPEYLKAPYDRPLSEILSVGNRLAETIEYCMRDSEIVYKAMNLLQGTVNELGGNLRNTLASTFMDIYRHSYMDEPLRKVPSEINERLAPFYGGGRCENLVYGGIEPANVYDVHSMYPSVMVENEFPNPNDLEVSDGKDFERIIRDYEGVSFVDIESPHTELPLLGLHFSGHYIFPTGRVKYAFTHKELRRALEVGYKIYSCEWQVYSKTSIAPFKQLVNELYSKRLAFKKNRDARERAVKIILNSGYGKWAQLNHYPAYKIRIPDGSEKPDFGAGWLFVQWGDIGFFYEPLPTGRLPAYTNLLWAMQITSAARVKLYNKMAEFYPNVAYCDTDSVHTDKTHNVSKQLGKWDYEKGGNRGEYKGSKFYRIRDSEGVWHYTIRGVPLYERPTYWEAGEISFYRPLGLREAVKKTKYPAKWVLVTKANRNTPQKRVVLSKERYPGSDGLRTRPYTVEEAAQVFGPLGK